MEIKEGGERQIVERKNRLDTATETGTTAAAKTK